MKYSNSIEYNISTKLDKTGISQLQTQIKQVELAMQQMANRKLISEPKVQDARKQLQGLSTALTKAFNPSLGMLDLSKFRAELRESHVSAEGLQTAFSLTGAQGAQAFGSLAKQIGNFNNGLERTSSTIDKLAVTFGNTFRWGLISSFFSQFMNAIHSSVEYAKELDESLTQIMLVTDYSRDNMNEYAKAANEAAKAVGQTTVGMTNASLIFAQQGYDLNRSQELATLSARLANASQQDTAATSDQITAYMNAYGLQDNMEELAQAMDNWALIANISAADVEEIALASQRAASMANAVGVSGEALAAQIATIESVTREAPEQIGNGLKTLYARFSDLQLGKEDEDGIGLGKVTSTLESIGVQVLDSLGNVRSMDDIMEDLMAIWQDLDDTTQEAVAQTLAGKHQVNRFTALMDNADMYQEYLGATGANAAGTLEQMNQEYLDSLQGRMATLQATLEGLFNDVFTTDMVYPLIDALTGLAKAVDTLFKSVGGGPTIILGLASAFTRLFSNSIARGINDMISNKEIANIRKSNLANIQGALEDTGLNNTGVGQFIQAGADRAKAMNAEQYRAYTEQLDNYIIAAQNAATANEKLEDTYRLVGAAAGVAFKDTDLIFKEDGTINTTNLVEELNGVLQNKEALQMLSNVDYSKAVAGAEEYSAALGKLNTSIYTMQKEGSQSPFASWNLDQSLNALDDAEVALNRLHEAYGITNDEFAEGKALLDTATNELANYGHVSDDTAKKLQNLNGGMARFTQALRRINPEVLKQGPEAIEAAIRQEIAAIKEEERALKSSQGFIANLDRQLVIKGIIDTASAIGQLTFAMQSMANIPSIISDSSLSGAEKAQQIIANLAVSIPSLITSISTINKAINDVLSAMSSAGEAAARKLNTEAIKEEAQAQRDLNAAKTEGVTTEEVDTAATETNTAAKGAEAAASNAVADAKKEEASATGETVVVTNADTAASEEDALAKGAQAAATKEAAVEQKGLNAAMAANVITAVIIGIIALVSWLAKWREEQHALMQERIESSNELVAANREALDSIEKLYNTWKETGEGAEELDQALKDQAEALGIVVTAADNYETLKQKIEEATAAQMYYNAVLRDGEYSDRPEFSNNGIAGLSSDQRAALGWGAHEVLNENNGISYTEYGINNYNEAYQTASARRQEILDELHEQEKVLRNINRSTAEGERQYQEQLETVRGLNSELGNLDTFLQANEAAYNDRYERGEQITLSEALGTEREFDNISWEEAQTNVRAMSDAHELELSDEQITQIAYNALVAAGNLEAAAEGMSDFVVASSALTNTNLDQIDVWSDRFDNFLDGLNVSSEQKTSLFEMIDWSSDNVDEEVRNLIAQIRESLANGLSLEEIIANPNIILQPEFSWDQTDIDLDYTQEEAEKILKDAGLEDVSVDEYVDSFLAMGGAGAEAADEVLTLTEEIKNLEEELKEIPEGTEAWERQNQALTDARDRLRNLALASLQTANGIKQLSSQWKSISENINSANIADQVAGYQNLQPILADILNVDSSAITQDVMQDVQMQSNIQRIAEGDMAALEDLRSRYGEIVVTAYLENTGFSGDLEQMQKIVNYANENIDDIEVGATLDISQYQSALQDMLISGQMTAEQLQNVFNGIGYDVQVDYVPVELPNAMTTIDIGSSVAAAQTIAKLTNPGVNPAVVAGKTTMRIMSETYKANVTKMPQITLTKKGGASSGGAGRAGGSGGGCFVAGTLVSTQDSFKEIENIQIGDIVLSYNEEIHQNEYSIVLQTMIHDVTEEIYDLYIEDEILTVTGIHRFYIRRKHNIDWIPASDLRIGDYVLFADGNWHPIFKIKIKVRSLLVYNFEVSHNHNYYVGRNQILAHNKGGSGGSGGTSNTMEPKEPIDHEIDYYEEVDSQLDKIGETLSGIEKQEDRLIGEKARQNQAKQIDLLNEEIDLQQKKLNILQKQNNGELTNTWKQISNPSTTIINNLTQTLTEAEKKIFDSLAKSLINGKIPIPLDVDKDGIIENFEDISAALDTTENNLINKYNSLIDSYNKSNSDSTKEQIEALDKIISKFEEEAGKVRENVQRYNDLQTEAQKLKNTIADLQDQIEDLNIEVYKGSLDALDKLKEINETGAGFAGFFTGLDEDNPLRKITEDLFKLNQTFEISKDNAKAFFESMKHTMATDESQKYFQDLIDGLTDEDLKNGRIGILAKELNKLRAWSLGRDRENNPFGENTQALKETYEEVFKKLEEEISDWQSEEKDLLDNTVDYYDTINEKQQEYIDQFEHLADKMEWLKDIYSIRYGDESYQALSDIGTKQAEILRDQLKQQVSIYNYWTDQYIKAVETGNEELIKEMRENMNEAEEKMQDIAKESAETFVDAYNDAVDAAIQKIYQATIGENNLDRLDRNWEWDKKNIDGYRDEVERTFEVEQLRNKYNDLLNGAQNSSLAIQNKIREQMQEQLELLENQKTMSEYDVKLANSKLLILQKEIALEEAQRNKNQMQLRRDSQGNYRYVYRANQNDVAKARQEYIQAIQDAYELTKEQRQKTAEELGKTLKDYAKQYADLNKNMNLSDTERALQSQELRYRFLKYMQNLQEDLMDTGYGLSDVLNSMIENGTEDIAETARIMLDKAFDIDGNLKIGSTGIEWLDALTDYLGITYDEIEKATGDLTDQTKQDADKLSQQINDVFSTVPDKITEYNETIEKTENQTNALTESTQNYLDTLKELPNDIKEALTKISQYNDLLKETVSWLTGIQNAYIDLIRLNTDELPYELGGANVSSWYSSPLFSNYDDSLQVKDYLNVYRILANWSPNQLYIPDIVGFDTGGYTGDWGKNGKLAILHEKELVLNAQDTENVYAAVKAAKQFAASLEANFLTHLIKSKPTFNTGHDSIEQRVEIKAEFPSVRDAFEIETALTNLADKAYQYAHTERFKGRKQ